MNEENSSFAIILYNLPFKHFISYISIEYSNIESYSNIEYSINTIDSWSSVNY